MSDTRSRALTWGFALAACLVSVAALAPWIAPNDPLAIDLSQRLSPPSWQFPLGTDRLGRCVLSRTLVGAPTSLGLSLIASAGVCGLALIVGGVSAFAGRRLDRILMRGVDALIAFPAFILALALVGVMGPSAGAAVAAIAWAWWPAEARVVRSLVASARQRDFVEAAWLAGVSPERAAWRHVLPQVAPALAVRASLEVASIILGLSALSFLGLGMQPPNPEWGAMLNDARPFVTTAPYLLAGPGIGLVLSVLACNLIAEGLRNRIDARQAAEW